jgi:hypothetical protein
MRQPLRNNNHVTLGSSIQSQSQSQSYNSFKMCWELMVTAGDCSSAVLSRLVFSFHLTTFFSSCLPCCVVLLHARCFELGWRPRHSVAVSNRSEEEEEEKNVLPVQAKRERGARSFCNYKRKRKAATRKVCALTKFINYFFFSQVVSTIANI